MKRLALLFVLPFVLLIPTASHADSPHVGCYHGSLNPETSDHSDDGDFKLQHAASGMKIVAAYHCGHVSWSKILAPSSMKCNVNAFLDVEKIAVHQGAFDYSGNQAIGPEASKRHVRFKGHWVNSTKVRGFTRINGDGCDSGREHWTFKYNSNT